MAMERILRPNQPDIMCIQRGLFDHHIPGIILKINNYGAQYPPSTKISVCRTRSVSMITSCLGINTHSGGIGAGITCKIKVCSNQLDRFTLSAHRDLVPPDVLGLWWYKVANFCVDIARRDRVHPRELYPFDC
jgi:hypothetical protein